RIVNQILQKELPDQYMGTSNLMFAKELDAKPIGTNAHELRMIPSALYDDPQDIIDEMYNIDIKWQKHFPDLAILLPDTYGTTFYQKNAPKSIIVDHTGNRFDSKDPMIAIPEYINWLVANGQDPMTKAAIPSDGLNAQKAVDITKAFKGQIGMLAYGIGTNFSNNTKGTWPRETEPFGPFGSFSVVVKPSRVKRPDGTWVSTVKLSDNPDKAVGEQQRVQKYKDVFGAEGFQREAVLV
ncbi:nicotinate phosphoribosyltransferase, partial [Candidatus Gracilibacteria bacterium]|nr:nicotinate phosphoribosyltransferase [Candidatus Gracilibacteria bacterium]